VPAHHQPPCRELRIDPQGLAVSERHAATCLSLPCHPQLSDEQVQQVIDAVNRF
jgi:dTDP-4-amino-4,6-dideoxygalactose transaminase